MYSVRTTQSHQMSTPNYTHCTKAEMISVPRRAAGGYLDWYKKVHRHRLNKVVQWAEGKLSPCSITQRSMQWTCGTSATRNGFLLLRNGLSSHSIWWWMSLRPCIEFVKDSQIRRICDDFIFCINPPSWRLQFEISLSKPNTHPSSCFISLYSILRKPNTDFVHQLLFYQICPNICPSSTQTFPSIHKTKTQHIAIRLFAVLNSGDTNLHNFRIIYFHHLTMAVQ